MASLSSRGMYAPKGNMMLEQANVPAIPTPAVVIGQGECWIAYRVLKGE